MPVTLLLALDTVIFPIANVIRTANPPLRNVSMNAWIVPPLVLLNITRPQGNMTDSNSGTAKIHAIKSLTSTLRQKLGNDYSRRSDTRQYTRSSTDAYATKRDRFKKLLKDPLEIRCVRSTYQHDRRAYFFHATYMLVVGSVQ